MDGLFSQSNFGIVTRMTVWLMPAPEYFQAYYFHCRNDDDVIPLIDALRPLRLDGTIRGASHIVNDYKVLSALKQYPWEETGGRTPLQPPLMEKFRREMKIGAWNGSGALYGTKAQVKEARRLLRGALRGTVAKLQFLDDRMLHLASLFAKPYQLFSGLNLRQTLAVLKPVHELMKGVPTEYPMASTYWRKRTPPPAAMDPDRDGCGLLWCSPVSPADGHHARRLTGITSEVLFRYGFEPMISVTMITERALACVVSIAFDREVPGEDEQAMSCYQDLLRTLASAGYYSYRLGVGAMPGAGRSGSYTDLLNKVKQVLDPNGVLAPGRYLKPTGLTAGAQPTPALARH
jgi:4-cresol dehydrogenase (hydroxylating)